MSPKGGASTATSGGDFSCISPGGREELVGKRFLLVAASTKSSKSPPKLSRISEWNWKAGVIRCASHVDSRDPELQVRYFFFYLTSFLSFYDIYFSIEVQYFVEMKYDVAHVLGLSSRARV